MHEDTLSLERDVEKTLYEIEQVVLTSEFQALLAEIYALPESARPQFIHEVVLRKSELARRGIVIPSEMTVQRSSFADERPTLFCVCKRLHSHPEKKATFTFDNTAGVLPLPAEPNAEGGQGVSIRR